MFDLITGNMERPLRERSPRSKVVAVVAHIVAVTVFVSIPLLRVTNALPDVPTMMAFVAASPAPPPPTRPPVKKVAAGQAVARPEPKPTEPAAAPIEEPSTIAPEPARAGRLADAEGVEGGVEGSISGGVLGGIVGGLVAAAPQPPPPPAAPPQPVRIGGQLAAPALLYRVEPVYPEIAVSAKVVGMVILEALIGTDGCVESVKVLRSDSKLLSGPSVDALKQWQYSPLLLNDIATPFVLTVTFNFSVKR